MAMLRVSSYRRLFEEQQWGRGNSASLMCGGQYRASARGVAAGSQWAEPDFGAARVANREAVSRYVKERTLIAALNDRLAFFIETARCLEEENECLEAEILELEETRGGLAPCAAAPVPDLGLQAVVERLRREKEQILCDTERLTKELQTLQVRHEEAAEHRTLIQLEREDVAVDVDMLCSECLALRDQVAIYEDELARLQEEQQTTIESLVEPSDGVATVTVEFPTPDVTPIISDIKEYYCQLTESLQFESQAALAVALRDQKGAGVAQISKRGEAVGVGDASKVTDVDELRKMIAELQRELAGLEKCGEELEVEIEERREAYLEEIAELQCCVEELEGSQAELNAQMSEQCADYDELLSEKMSLDMEIAAYRGLVELEEDRLCFL
ncbi:type III intermediate filament [Conger conger]|uniref:type III intermediate filament n=1 Tax=Conger conger TaxID=82655 RepID=UPI002A5A08D2|nr:type III intermediate filament [Conger conger]